MFNSPDEVLGFIRDEDVKFVDVRFSDLPGIMQHFTVPAQSWDADAIEGGVAFDGSSVRGFQAIHESDMLLLPDLATARI
ncbi:MAG TPA: glutamine synthetase beta-grasp domain-containing protein, partial [Pseudonocardiaceae bacterium]|nr:glutamine synthetase beta-grasp domain-containing protein [Pseudonocardiaceae bacterium]